MTASPERYDLILDIGGNSPLPRLRRALTPSGTLVIVGGEDGGKLTGMGRQVRALALSPFVRQRLTAFISKEHHADLEPLTQFIEAGQVAPIVGNTYPLAEVPDAMRHLEAGDARGKIVHHDLILLQPPAGNGWRRVRALVLARDGYACVVVGKEG